MKKPQVVYLSPAQRASQERERRRQEMRIEARRVPKKGKPHRDAAFSRLVSNPQVKKEDA